MAILAAVTGCGRSVDGPSSGPRLIWTHADAAGARSQPYADDSIAVFMNAFTPRLSELNAADGTVRWQAPNGSWLGGTDHAGALTPDLFIVSSTNGSIYGLDRQTGSIRWQYQGRAPIQSGVALLNGIAVTAAVNGDITGLDAESGALRWQTTTGGSSVIIQVTSDSSCAYVSVGSLMCVDDSGHVRWQTGGASGGGPTYFTAVQSTRGRLFAGSEQGFHALAP